MNNKIVTHKVLEKLEGKIAFLKHIPESKELPVIDYAHRDDYYNFIFIEEGKVKLSVDFEEYEINGTSVFCILPGQMHSIIEYENVNAWILLVDSILVKDEYREIFEKVSFFKSRTELNTSALGNLKDCISIIQKRFALQDQLIEQNILHALISAYIGMIAETYREGFPVIFNKRLAAITFHFKKLLSVNYQTMKSVSQYASEMNLSPVYLSEAVKKTTGLTAGEHIQNQIILQAKRLLFYTKMNIKEVALTLGYEDRAYFTRLFTKVSSLSPTQFRSKYLK